MIVFLFLTVIVALDDFGGGIVKCGGVYQYKRCDSIMGTRKRRIRVPITRAPIRLFLAIFCFYAILKRRKDEMALRVV